MKLNCGPDRYTRNVRRNAYLSNWHRFFALWPRRIKGTEQCRCFEWIERRGDPGYEGGWCWEYRLIEELTS